MIHEKALKEFERGVGLLQKQSYSEAMERFQSIVGSSHRRRSSPDRAQVYLKICQNMLERKDPQPRKPEDFFYFGVIKANEANYDEAASFCRRRSRRTPGTRRCTMSWPRPWPPKGIAGRRSTTCVRRSS